MKLLYRLDIMLLAAISIMILLGITMIYSAACHSESPAERTTWGTLKSRYP